jgi:glucose-1-phosphate thymidylyltransferase
MELLGVVVVEDARSDSDRRRRFNGAAHVANQPIAHQVLSSLEAEGVRRIIVVSSRALAREVRACFEARTGHPADLSYLHREGPLDLAGGLELAVPAVNGSPCIVHLASGLLDQTLAPFIDRLRPRCPDVTLIARRSARDDDTLDPSGVWLFGRDALRRIAGSGLPQTDGLDASLIAERVTAGSGKFSVHLVDSWQSYNGDPSELLELNRIALDRLDPGRQAPPVRHRHSRRSIAHPVARGNQIEGRVSIDEEACVTGSVILGPTVIGAGAIINEAYIGPYTSIGERVRIEGAEVERSIICPGASITHVGGRLVASVVGRDARVFHDFSLPRALRLWVGDGTEIALC